MEEQERYVHPHRLKYSTDIRKARVDLMEIARELAASGGVNCAAAARRVRWTVITKMRQRKQRRAKGYHRPWRTVTWSEKLAIEAMAMDENVTQQEIATAFKTKEYPMGCSAGRISEFLGGIRS